MLRGESKPEESSSVAVHCETIDSTSPLPACRSATNNSEFTPPLDISHPVPRTPCVAVWANKMNENSESHPPEESVIPERTMQQTLIIVEEEPALMHTRHVQYDSNAAQEYLDMVYSWSPATSDFAELIPIGTTQSERESVFTHETEASPYSPDETSSGSSRAEVTSSLSQVSTAPGVSAQNGTVARNTLSMPSSTHVNSLGTESVQDTPDNSVLRPRMTHAGETADSIVNPLCKTHDTDPAVLPHISASPLSSSLEFHRCATAAPTSLQLPSPEPERNLLPSMKAKNGAPEASVVPPASAAFSPINLRVLVNHGDIDGSTPSPALLSLNSTNATKRNASGGTVPNVPAIRLPVSPATPGMESDRSVSVMGYGPRSAPNACSLVSTRSGRSSRSARHSHRGGTSMRTALPSLKKLFPTLPDEMYIGRERLCVAHDRSGHLGTGGYGVVQRAELYPPEVEVSRFFSPVTETFTNPSNPNTPGYSPANPLLLSHNFPSVASSVGGADGNAATLSVGAHGKEHSNVLLHSRLESMVSMDSVSTLPLHQLPYSDQTASFYNGLDDLPALPCAESFNDSHWTTRGQSPEAESVVVCGPLAVHTDSEELSASAARNTKNRQGIQHSSSVGWLSVEQQEHNVSTPLTPLTSCCISQKFPDLSAALAKTKDGGFDAFSPTSKSISIAKLAREELDVDVDDNTVRTSAGEGEMKGMLAGPLEDSAISEETDFSVAPTTGTHMFTSPSSPRWINKTYCRSSRTADGDVPGAREREGEWESHSDHPEDSIFTALTIQSPFEEDEAAQVNGDEENGFNKMTSRRTTKAHLGEMPSNEGKSDATLLMQPDANTDAAKKDGRDGHDEAALCLPLVLSRGRCMNTSPTSCNTADSNPTDSDRRDATATSTESERKTLVVVHKDNEMAAEERLGARNENDVGTDYKPRSAGSISPPDSRGTSFFARVTAPESQGSPAPAGDDALTSTAQQAVAQAVHEFREELEDAFGHLIRGRRDASESAEAEKTDASVKQTHVDRREEGNDVGGDEKGVESAAAALSMKQVSQTNLFHSGMPTLTSTTTPRHLPMGGATTTTASNSEGKRVEPVSPASTVSSLFSGGVTNLTTTRTSKQVGVGMTPYNDIKPLQLPSNALQTPLVRYGVNSMVISEAVNNGCVPFRPVATKVVEKSDLAENPMKLNAFHNELRMASRLNHPCLVNMFGAAEDVESFYLVMDLAEKGNLSQYQRAFGVKDTRLMAPRFLADVVLALEYLQDGSQHTYWMRSPTSEAPQQSSVSGEGNEDGNDAEKTDRRGSGSCPRSTSTLSLQWNADDSSLITTPKPSALLSVPGASLQRPAEGANGEGDGNPVTSTAMEEDTKGGGVPTCACSPAKLQDDKVLMKESIVLHRDIKPDNMLLTWDFHVKLADFGDACFYGDEEANTFGGTPSYISPEVIQTSKAGPCSDLWAMGCVLYELLVGEKLFTGSLREVAESIQTFSPDNMVFPTTSTKSSDTSVDDDGFDGDNNAAVAQAEAEDDRSGSSGTISKAAKDLVRQLLRHVPEERLGSAERGGFSTLKRHPFFAEIDWDTVLETTNITTTNTDYASELANYLEPGESVVYCSPVKVLPTGGAESHARTRAAHLDAQGLLVMVLTDTPRLFLVNPDIDTVQFWLPWSPELRVGVLRADRFTITVPINDVLLPSSTLGTDFNGGALMSMTSRNSTSTASTITYTFYDTTRRADLWGVKIHHLQSICPPRREGGTPAFPSFQSSTTRLTSTNGVLQLHCSPLWTTHRGTPTRSPRTGGCLLHRLRTTPRSARTGSISSHPMPFAEAAIMTPRDGWSAMMSNMGSFTETVNSHSGPVTAATSPATTGVPAESKPIPITRYLQPIRQRATSFSVPRAPSFVPAVCASGRPGTILTSPCGMSSGGSSTELRSPEVHPASQAAAATVAVVPVHRRVNTMTVTVASSGNPQPSCRVRPPLGNVVAESNAGVSPVGFGAAATEWWVRAAEGRSTSATANDSSLKSARPCSSGATTNWSTTTTRTGSVHGSDIGWGSFGEEALDCSSSAGDAITRATRASDGEDSVRTFTRDSTQSEAASGPSSAPRTAYVEPEMGCCSCPSQGHDRGTGTPVRISSLRSASAKALPQEQESKARQQYKETQRKKRTGVAAATAHSFSR